MKILRVINTMDPTYGGPCQGIRNTIPALSKLGIINEVVCLDAIDSPYLADDDFKIHALGKAIGPWSHSKKLVPWLVDNLHNYDSVILHGLWLYHGYAVLKALKLLSNKGTRLPKMFVMPHGMLDPYFQNATGRRFKALRNLLYWHLIESKIVNSAEGILFTCQQELLLARTTFRNYKPKKELNVGYGIQYPPDRSITDLSFYSNLVTSGNDEFILYLSRLHEKKGTDMLIRAYLKLKSEVNQLPNLVIAGPGLESSFGRKLLNLAKGENGINFIGMIKGKEKWTAFYKCSAFILPSHQENFGISVVEALSCGKPVLITDQVNIWREIQDTNSGLISSDTEDGIYHLLKSWLELNEDSKRDMCQNAEQTFLQYYTNDIAAKNLITALNNSTNE